jgi:transposase-like protein
MLQTECNKCKSKNLSIVTTGTMRPIPRKRFKCNDCFAFQNQVLSEEDCIEFYKKPSFEDT